MLRNDHRFESWAGNVTVGSIKRIKLKSTMNSLNSQLSTAIGLDSVTNRQPRTKIQHLDMYLNSSLEKQQNLKVVITCCRPDAAGLTELCISSSVLSEEG